MHKITVKKRVRARDGNRCTKCGMTAAAHLERYGRALDVHRSTPGSRYTVDGCVTVCRPCHHKEPKLPNGLGEPKGDGVRTWIEFPIAVAEKLRAEAGPGKVQSFVVGAVAKKLKVPYKVPTRGRPKGKVSK